MAPTTGRSIDVLHVEDDRDFADLAATYLERERDAFDVHSVYDPEAGLERLEAGDIDCIVSDYQMPGTNGIEFLEAVRAENPDLPFILFTGKGSEEIASDAISAGVTDYLQKAGGADQYTVLANRIENAVSQYQAEQMVDRAFGAMDRSREGIALLDENGEFIYVNAAYSDIVGYEKDELTGSFWELVYPDDQVERIHEDILSEVPEEGHWTGDTVYQRKDGSRVLVNHAMVYSEEGTMICLLRDVSDAESHQETLREERERFEFFVDTVEEYAIFLLDPNGYITTWNPGAERITGHSQAEILGDHVSSVVPESAQSEGRTEEMLENARADGTVRETMWLQRDDGTDFLTDVTITALTEDEGILRGFGMVTRDLTDRRERKQAINLQEEVVDTLPDVFYVVDQDGTFERFNQEMVETSGYSPDELASMDALELVPEEDRDRFEDQHEQLFETDEIVTIESWLITKDGTHIPHEFRRRRVTDAEGTVLGFAGIGRDITEQKEYERRLEQHVDRLNEFASVLTHDLRNPLSVAQGHLPMIEEELEESDNDHVEAIDRSHDRIEAIIDDVLEITRTGLPVTEPDQTDIGALADRMWHDMEKGAVHPNLAIEEVDPVLADPSLLERLLMNLFRNTVEHGDTEVLVRVGPLEDGFYIEDDGPGIPPSEREEIFDWKFTTKAEGSGIGLKSVEQIAHAHDWDITVTEGAEGGARFEITGVEFVE